LALIGTNAPERHRKKAADRELRSIGANWPVRVDVENDILPRHVGGRFAPIRSANAGNGDVIGGRIPA
jgi:hypothetical protein